MSQVGAVPVPAEQATPKQLRQLLSSQTAKWHQQARAFLSEHLAEPFAGKTVAVTHHLPSLRSVAARFQGDLTNGAFASNLDHLVGQVDLWVHGHTHDSVDCWRSRKTDHRCSLKIDQGRKLAASAASVG